MKHPFPEFPGERFLGEGSSFFFIELESKGVYINRVIYLCDYREDGLTKAGRKMRLQNPRGGRFNSMTYMHKRLPLKTRVKKAILYVCYSWFADCSRNKCQKCQQFIRILPNGSYRRTICKPAVF